MWDWRGTRDWTFFSLSIIDQKIQDRERVSNEYCSTSSKTRSHRHGDPKQRSSGKARCHWESGQRSPDDCKIKPSRERQAYKNRLLLKMITFLHINKELKFQDAPPRKRRTWTDEWSLFIGNAAFDILPFLMYQIWFLLDSLGFFFVTIARGCSRQFRKFFALHFPEKSKTFFFFNSFNDEWRIRSKPKTQPFHLRWRTAGNCFPAFGPFLLTNLHHPLHLRHDARQSCIN